MDVKSELINGAGTETKVNADSSDSTNYILMFLILVIVIFNLVFKNFFTAGISAAVLLLYIGYHIRVARALRSDILEKLHMMEVWAEKNEKAEEYADINMFEKSVEEMQTAEKIKVTTNLYSDLSAMLEELGRYKESLEYCEKALKFLEMEFENDEIKDIYKAFLYISKGNLLGKLNQFDDGREYISKSLKLNEKNPVAYYALGEIYGFEGDKKNEEIFVKKAYSIDPYFPEKWGTVSIYKRYIYRKNQRYDKIRKINDYDNKAYHEKDESYKTYVTLKKDFIHESKVVHSKKHNSSFIMTVASGIVVAVFITLYLLGENGFFKLVNYETVVKNCKVDYESVETFINDNVIKNQKVNIKKALLVENSKGQLFLKPFAEKLIENVKAFDKKVKLREREIQNFSSSINMLRILRNNNKTWEQYKLIKSNPVFDSVKSDIEYFSKKFKKEKKPNIIALVMLGGAIRDKYLNRFYENEIMWFNRSLKMIMGINNIEVLNVISNEAIPNLTVNDVKDGKMSKILFNIVDYLYRRSSKEISGVVTDISHRGDRVVSLKIDSSVKYSPQDLYLSFIASVVLVITFLFFLIRHFLYPQYIYIVKK